MDRQFKLTIPILKAKGFFINFCGEPRPYRAVISQNKLSMEVDTRIKILLYCYINKGYVNYGNRR